MRFFVLVFLVALAGCSGSRKEIALRWEGTKATGLVVPSTTCTTVSKLTVRLKDAPKNVPLLGEWTEEKNGWLFTPIASFTPGLSYEIFCDGEKQGDFSIPLSEAETPRLLAIYPSSDTLPMNLLKMYFHFSQPMAEGRSADHIFLLHDRDTLIDTFLDLQPELWNEDGTVLTLWLDPGRIKRDLQPNMQQGNPLKEGKQYELRVSTGWKSKEGVALQKSHSKIFVAGARDEQMPNVQSWTVQIPRSNTRDVIRVNFHEPLDYALIYHAITFQSSKGEVMGSFAVKEDETGLEFIPEQAWTKGTYELTVEGRLEDLCGNNLNRPFDRDLKSGAGESEQPIFKREFRIDQ